MTHRGAGDGIYVRVGSVDRQASLEVVTALERESSAVSFDQEMRTDVDWEGLDLDGFVAAYRRRSGRDRALMVSEDRAYGCWRNVRTLLLGFGVELLWYRAFLRHYRLSDYTLAEEPV